ncbi:MAG: hypothetical protein J6S67_23725 [Methanobrevibacter sp.]|nr:hypothetical protein [Methanobrevibacter sp.]
MPEYYKSFTADSVYDLNKNIEFYKEKIKEEYDEDVTVIIDITRDLAGEEKQVLKNMQKVITHYKYEYYVCISVINEEEL